MLFTLYEGVMEAGDYDGDQVIAGEERYILFPMEYESDLTVGKYIRDPYRNTFKIENAEIVETDAGKRLKISY